MPRERIHLAILLIGLMVVLAVLPFAIYGGDGSYLWLPILSEFLKGTESYKYSPVIFGGQNLLAIYGELPFWYVFRWFSFSPVLALNLTHFFWVVLAFFPGLVIYRGVSKEKDLLDPYLILLYCLLSPIIVNRLYAGHFNLLFGMLPFFIGVSLLFLSSLPYLIFSVFAIWCAFSIQSYQILAYHIFYVPLFLILLRLHSTNPKRDFLRIAFVMIAGVLLALPSLMAMIEHARDPENIRVNAGNVVYSYVITQLDDLCHFFMSSLNGLTQARPFIFFHELNYSMGLFVVWLAWVKLERMLKLTLFFMLLAFLSFSMNLLPFNFLAELPLISLFRVPQRSFMILAFFLPLYLMAKNRPRFTRLELELLVLIALVSGFYNLELWLVLSVAILGALKLGKVYLPPQGLMLKLVLASLLISGTDKWRWIARTNEDFGAAWAQVENLRKNYSDETMKNKMFYFLSQDPVTMNAAANLVGFRTVEGYGHPPAFFFQRLEGITGVALPPTTNQFHLPKGPGLPMALAEFEIDLVVTFPSPGKVKVFPVKKKQ